MGTCVWGVPKTAFRLHDLLEGLTEPSKAVIPTVALVTMKGYRLQSATEKGAEGRLWEIAVRASGLPLPVQQRCVT